MEFVKLEPHHDGVITDIVFDFYGQRCATCGIDRHIKIWTLDPEDGSWSVNDIPRAHQDIIWRLSWAHPEFGQLIASCSEDRTVCIWEEQESVTSSSSSTTRDTEKWVKKATLSDCKKSVNDVKFSPRHLGLKVATASADGLIRIYEANDIFSLTYWQIQDSFRVENTVPVSPNPQTDSSYSEHGLTCLSWNESPFEPPMIAIGGYSRRAVVWTQQNSKWIEECVLGTHADAIHDIAWAPSMGRSYHLIATTSREHTFQVHTVIRNNQGDLECKSSVVVSAPIPEGSESGSSSSPVWRVAWNATGTILATSSEDGSLSLWRKDFSGSWTQVKHIPAASNQFRSFYKGSS